MNKNKKILKTPVIICLIILVILLLILGYLFYICNKKTNTYVTFHQTSETELNEDIPIYLTFSIPIDKLWQHSDATYGAQYDGKFVNNTIHNFTDWTVTAKVVPNYWVDSTWNANFSYYYSKQQPIKVPKEDTYQFKSNSDYIVMTKYKDSMATEIQGKKTNKYAPFMIGMVMYARNTIDITDITIHGRFIYKPTENPFFYIILLLILIDSITIIVLLTIKTIIRKKIKSYEIRHKYYSEIILQSFKTFSNFVDAKDPYTKGHSIRVAYYAKEIAKRLKMNINQQEEIFWLGLMHDVGKIGVPDEILNKSTKLSDSEFTKIKEHTNKGYEILNDFTAMPKLKFIAKFHHENYDGSGYCTNLKKENIPIEARIIRICDSFDAMNSDRCYRKKLSKDQIIKEFQMNSGTSFDPKITEIMIQMIMENAIIKIEKIDSTANIQINE